MGKSKENRKQDHRGGKKPREFDKSLGVTLGEMSGAGNLALAILPKPAEATEEEAEEAQDVSDSNTASATEKEVEAVEAVVEAVEAVVEKEVRELVTRVSDPDLRKRYYRELPVTFSVHNSNEQKATDALIQHKVGNVAKWRVGVFVHFGADIDCGDVKGVSQKIGLAFQTELFKAGLNGAPGFEIMPKVPEIDETLKATENGYTIQHAVDQPHAFNYRVLTVDTKDGKEVNARYVWRNRRPGRKSEGESWVVEEESSESQLIKGFPLKVQGRDAVDRMAEALTDALFSKNAEAFQKARDQEFYEFLCGFLAEVRRLLTHSKQRHQVEESLTRLGEAFGD